MTFRGGNQPGRARREDQRALLEATLARGRETGAAGVAVFDLDSTLFDNRPRQARILAEYGRSLGDDPAGRLLAAALPEHWQGWDIRVAMHNAGLSPADVERHFAPARRFWKARFFTSEYCTLDVPLAGAPRFVNELAASGVQIAYVTGRHVSMGPGTLASLAQGGFPAPEAGRVHLLLKPSFDEEDDAWKREAPSRLDRLGRVFAAFDNEPAHVNVYAEAYPAALVIHLDTDHSGRPVAVHPRVPSILDFTR